MNEIKILVLSVRKLKIMFAYNQNRILGSENLLIAGNDIKTDWQEINCVTNEIRKVLHEALWSGRIHCRCCTLIQSLFYMQTLKYLTENKLT